MAKHNEIGAIGEDIACEFLANRGFKIVSRNYRKPYGEIDIVARETSGKYRFVEVKSVSHGTANPEENVHPQKVRRLMRVIQVYLASKGIEDDWQFDVVAVFVDPTTKEAKIRHTEDIILGS